MKKLNEKEARAELQKILDNHKCYVCGKSFSVDPKEYKKEGILLFKFGASGRKANKMITVHKGECDRSLKDKNIDMWFDLAFHSLRSTAENYNYKPYYTDKESCEIPVSMQHELKDFLRPFYNLYKKCSPFIKFL